MVGLVSLQMPSSGLTGSGQRKNGKDVARGREPGVVKGPRGGQRSCRERWEETGRQAGSDHVGP
jgi:hypothetical protein